MVWFRLGCKEALLIATCAVFGSCATATPAEQPVPDASSPTPDARPPKIIDAGPTIVASECPANQFATGVNEQGILNCAPFDSAAKTVVNEECTVFAGWRDSCDGCVSDPSKWGQVKSGSCENGLGVGNTCTVATLGASTVNLFGIDLNGEVNDDDKFYLGLQCQTVVETPVPAAPQCGVGSFLSGIAGDGQCVRAHSLVSQYVHDQCRVYLGWRDSCNGCTTGPLKLGRASSTSCTNTSGTSNTCTTTNIAGEPLQLFGLNTDGDVNNDDKFYVGFYCGGGVAETASAAETCPSDKLVTAILPDGSVECTSPVLEAENAIQNDCHLYYGWRDNCSGCSTAPSKWGRVSSKSCENGVGINNTCNNSFDLGDAIAPLFGLNTDGDVNGDDKFYVGFQCE